MPQQPQPPQPPAVVPTVQHTTQPTTVEPAAKRLKLDSPASNPPPAVPGSFPAPTSQQSSTNERLSESGFIATLSSPNEVPICVQIPHDPANANWNFNGQTIDLTLS